MRRISVLLILSVAGPLAAQSSGGPIDPGMTRAQVVERLGPPAAERSGHGLTMLYYVNSCEHRCGMADVVLLERDAVIDAIFRSTTRRYTGVSSSAYAIPAASARAGRATVSIAEPSRVRTNLPRIVAEPASRDSSHAAARPPSTGAAP
jgi:hypothetical protein